MHRGGMQTFQTIKQNTSLPGARKMPPPLRVQPKLKIGAVNDPAEAEADRVADQVMRMPAGNPVGEVLRGGGNAVQRKCASCDGDEVQRKPVEIRAKGDGGFSGNAATPQASSAIGALGTGAPLPASERSFFEPRFGRDLSGVRIHTGAQADTASKSINARAFTYGHNIAFARGEYQPGSARSRHLMAHELTHTMQQSGVIRRTCPTNYSGGGADTAFETKVDTALAHATYKALKVSDQKVATHITEIARGAPCPHYYADKLLLMFNTPLTPAATIASGKRKKIGSAVADEKKHLADPANAAKEQDQEKSAAAKGKKGWQSRKGEDGRTTYRVHAGDLGDIVVQMRVRLYPKGTGTNDDVKKTKSLEDAIERAAESRGYTLDIVFVDHAAPNVFGIGVDPGEWTNSDNWTGNPKTIAHEAQHVLGLEDRYNYIEAHANNSQMVFSDRLWWFREQMARPVDSLSNFSMMRDQSAKGAAFQDEDICAVVQGDFETCMTGRITSMSMDETETRAKDLMSPYDAGNAATLKLLREHWLVQKFMMTYRSYPMPTDAETAAIFGDPTVIDKDAKKFPLRNPHDVPDGSSLKGVKRKNP